MFLMLFVVFAAAGPGNPGVGDVFSMGPTMADGAVPHMLPSAADGGAGFVLGGWCSTLNFMSPLYASIAGQMCNQGAQKGIVHVPEGPMAGQASSWAQTEGISKIFLLYGKKLGSFFFSIFGRGRSCGAAREVCAHSLPQQRAWRW